MGLYTITTRAEGTVLTGFGAPVDIFNGDHQNHVTHTAAPFINSWEDSLAHMQATTDPNPATLPAALFEEIQRLRFAIARIKQKMAGANAPPFWYTAATDFSAAVTISPTAARMEQTIAQVIPNDTLTTVSFDTSIYDTTAMRLGSSFVIPADGTYSIGASLGFGDGATTGPPGTAQLRIRNTFAFASFIDIALNDVFSDVNTIPKALCVSTVARFTKGSLISAMVYQNGGSPKALIATATARPGFWIALVGRG